MIRSNSRLVVEQLPVATAVYEGPEHVFVSASAAYRRMIGGRDPVGRPIRAVLPELEGQGFIELLDAVYATGEPRSGLGVPSAWDDNGDGVAEPHFVDFTYAPLRDPEGSVIGVVAQVIDAGARVRAEAAVRESEALFRAVFDASAVGMALVDLSGRLAQVNPAFARMLGYAPEEVTARSVGELSHPDDMEADAALLGQLLAGERDTYRMEKRYLHRSGAVVWGRLSVSVTRDAAGEPLYLLGMVEDVTERRREEEEREFLAQASEILASSLDYAATLSAVTRLAVHGLADWCAVDETAPDGSIRRVAVAHRDPAKVELAYRFNERYPQDPDSPTGIPHVLRTGEPELVPHISDEMLESAGLDAEFLAAVRELDLGSYLSVPLVARGRTLAALTFVQGRARRAYGERDLWLAQQLARRAAVAIDNSRLYREAEAARARAESAAAELEMQAEELQSQAVRLEEMQAELETSNADLQLAVHDLAERTAEAEEAQAVLDAFFAGAPTAKAFVDRDLRYRRINPALAAIDGMAPDQIVGRTLREVVPHAADRLEPLYRRVLETGEPVSDVEVGVPRPDRPDSMAYYLVNYFPVRPPGGEVLGVGLVALDVTARREAEEAMRHAKEAAEEANHAKSAFLATMSHELRTPLNAILGYADLLRQGLPVAIPEGALRSVERIELSARYLRDLIEEILTFARIEAARETLEVGTVELHALADEVCAVIEPLAGRKAVEFRVEVPAEPVTLRTDPRKVRQILLNLLGNAVKFTERGQIAFRAWQEDGAVVLEVRDTGIGIAEDNLRRVFEPFWQAETAMHTRVGGTGLGLPVTQRLVEMLGGGIEVESRLGAGTTFRVRLPLTPSGSPG